jgi:alcohol dehydrogenase (cytochrome c)
MLQAIDYRTGAIAWSHEWADSPSVRSGLLSTAGNVLFAGDASSNFVAFDAAKGVPLWHERLHTSITNGPITYSLDNVQFVVVGAGDRLYAFSLRRSP